MEAAPPTPDETIRIKTLKELEILDSSAEAAWDRLVQLASRLCKTPIALVSLIDADRQWFKARVGLDVQETPREHSFCAHAIHDDAAFIVPDATKDQRFHDNPLVTGDPDIRFYAGAPIRAPNGTRLGTLCVIDRRPRELDAEQVEGLRMLADQAEALFRSRDAALALRRVFEDADEEELTQERVNQFADKILNPLTPILLRIAAMRRHEDLPSELLGHLEAVERSAKRIKDVSDRAARALLGITDGDD